MNIPLIIAFEYPPNIEDIKKVFPLNKDVVFCYGNVIYNPSKLHLSDDLLVHEGTHAERMQLNPALWWKQYLEDPAFRLVEELLAYRRQWLYLNNRDRQRMGPVFARILSSPLYGGIISFKEALTKITRKQ